MKHLSGISWSINCYLIKIICYWLLPDLTLYTIQIFFCFFVYSVILLAGYVAYIPFMLIKTLTCMNVFWKFMFKWVANGHTTLIECTLLFIFQSPTFCSCRFCIKNKANTEALNIYYCFIPLLIYFVTTDLFQYYFLVPKNWLESLWVTLSFFIGNFENFHSNCFQKRLMVYILV